MNRQQFNALVEESAREVLAAKERWLRESLRAFVPPVVLRWVDERKYLPQLAAYLEKRRLYVASHPDGRYVLMHGSVPVSQFVVSFKRQF